LTTSATGIADAVVEYSWCDSGWRANDGRKQAGKSDGTTEIYVTPKYFSVLRIPLLAARGILKSDTAESEPVVVVNAAFTRKNLGTSTVADAIGMHVNTEGKTFRIVGVAGVRGIF
jgi:hypothetical protein